MILSDREILAAIREKIILIDPTPAEALFTSTAVDLTHDEVVLRWKEPGNHPSGQPVKLYPFRKGFNIRALMSDPNYSARVAIDRKECF
jgi:dCTP deaminase